MKTQDYFRIIFSSGFDENITQDEVDGIIFHGLWKPNQTPNLPYKEFLELWKSFNGKIDSESWEGEDNADISISIHIQKWDKDLWNNTISNSLDWFIKNGARIAWCGSELISSSTDELHSEEDTEIYAAHTNETGVICNCRGLDGTFKGLSKKDLSRLTDNIS